MRIASLQFSPELGRVEENVARADALLASVPAASLANLDLLVLPELAFTGYNHTLPSILPHLEPTSAGPSTQWAIRTALRHGCLVSVGYPEIFSPNPPPPGSLRPTMIDLGPGSAEAHYPVTAYNAVVTVNARGEVVAHSRKTNLYYADETWAQEAPDGFSAHDLVVAGPAGSCVRTTFAICMDLNPHHFLPASTARLSLADHVLASRSRLLVLATAWLTDSPSSALGDAQPDKDTLAHWFGELGPLIRDDEERICVFANRCGEEAGKAHPNEVGEGNGVRYAGSSWIGVVGKGRVRLGRIMGKVEEGVCGVVDTDLLDVGGGWEVKFGEGQGDGWIRGK
ncbi:MAG: hypothetical protein LQ348_003261 [Seirophora lacunosa]|nr:MAG: hypothetical protein LQ348_003261 [Seirophora lacunosa]